MSDRQKLANSIGKAKRLGTLRFHDTKTKQCCVAEKPTLDAAMAPQKEGSYYACAACRQALFSASSWFSFADCQGPVPSFSSSFRGALTCRVEMANGMAVTACSQCGAFVGCVFEADAYSTTGERHRANAAALTLMTAADIPAGAVESLMDARVAEAMRRAVQSLASSSLRHSDIDEAD